MKSGYIAALSIALAFLAYAVSAQQSGFNPAAISRQALAEPFVGVTSDGSPQTGLYEFRKTAVSTAPVLDAARRLLASMNRKHREKLLELIGLFVSDIRDGHAEIKRDEVRTHLDKT